jgi:hypothetical protein
VWCAIVPVVALQGIHVQHCTHVDMLACACHLLYMLSMSRSTTSHSWSGRSVPEFQTQSLCLESGLATAALFLIVNEGVSMACSCRWFVLGEGVTGGATAVIQ